MARAKDKRSARLFALRLQALRRARRADRRRRKALRRGDRLAARRARDVARRQRQKARQYLEDRRARRKALRYRLKLKPRSGLAYFEGKQVAGWIYPILVRARATGKWKGGLTSGFRSYAKQWYIYFVARIRPAAYPGQSNHEGKDYPRGAIDTNDPWGLKAAIKETGDYGRLKPYMDFVGNNDPWHFSATGR